MKILCLIDSLGSGGSQRQMVNLICGLKAKGHDVELLVYHPEITFFREVIDRAGVLVHTVEKCKWLPVCVVTKLVGLLRVGNYNTMISFLIVPNLYAEISKIVSGTTVQLIVGERSSYSAESKYSLARLFRVFHIFSDVVVANSYSHSEWLMRYSWLRNKTCVIYNGYQILPQSKVNVVENKNNEIIQLLVISRINSVKNGLLLVKALVLFYQKNGFVPLLKWAGRQENDRLSLENRIQIDAILAANPFVYNNWKWLGERSDIYQLLNESDGLIHLSRHEGLPNAVCEAFIAARPVIISNVCDHPLLVRDGVRGFLCDADSPASICNAIERFIFISQKQRKKMGKNAKIYARKNLALKKMVSSYELLARGVGRVLL